MVCTTANIRVCAADSELQEMYPFDLGALVSIAPLFMGLGAFVWIPLSLAIGRRPVFVLCTILLTLSTLGCGLSRSFYQHLVAHAFQGLSVGIILSVVSNCFPFMLTITYQYQILLMIIDLTFIHQRATTIALYWSLCGATANILLSPTTTLVASTGSFRYFYFVWLSPCTVTILLALFFVPETYFCRPPVAFDGRVVIQSSSEKLTIYDGWEGLYDEKALPELPTTRVKAKLQELKFWGTMTKGGWKAMFDCYPQIMLSILNPLVFWVILLNTLVLGGLVSVDSSCVALLSAPPYNLKTQKIGFIKFSAAAGSLLAYPAAGIFTSRISRCLTARNGGMRTPEHYLPSFILPVLCAFTGACVYGVAGERHLHWILIYVAYGLIYFSFVSLFTSNALWATEAFPRWAAAALTAVAGSSYVLSFALSFATGPWIAKVGFAKMNCEVGGLILVVGCVGIPIAIWGQRWRGYIQERWCVNEGGALRPH